MKKKILPWWIVATMILLSFSPRQEAARPASAELSIYPVIQDTYVWCWAAVAEMILTHYGLPNLNPAGEFQCGIVAAYFGPNTICWANCTHPACIVPIGAVSNLKTLIDNYGRRANAMGASSRVLSSRLAFSALSFEGVVREIDKDRPIMAGISPTGFALPNASMHFSLIVGYEIDDVTQEKYLIVNDPFPFWHQDFTGQSNPYFQNGGEEVVPGQYKIPYSSFRRQLQWANTIYNIN
jgi:hypothetical protein